jgi:hypothetical protein
MKIYLITEEQIQKLYDAYTPGSRDFDRVIREVKRMDINLRGDGTYQIRKTELPQATGGGVGDAKGRGEPRDPDSPGAGG